MFWLRNKRISFLLPILNSKPVNTITADLTLVSARKLPYYYYLHVRLHTIETFVLAPNC